MTCNNHAIGIASTIQEVVHQLDLLELEKPGKNNDQLAKIPFDYYNNV